MKKVYIAEEKMAKYEYEGNKLNVKLFNPTDGGSIDIEDVEDDNLSQKSLISIVMEFIDSPEDDPKEIISYEDQIVHFFNDNDSLAVSAFINSSYEIEYSEFKEILETTIDIDPDNGEYGDYDNYEDYVIGFIDDLISKVEKGDL